MWIAVIYLWAVNGLTLFAIGTDKLKARRRRRRIPERRLLWLAALGGSPAAILGRWIFNHKTRKRGFSLYLIMIFASQTLLIHLLMSEVLPGTG